MTFSKSVIEKRIIYTWRKAVESNKDLKKTMAQPFKFFGTSRGSFFLNAKGINGFNKILDEFKKDNDVSRKFSKKYLEELIRDVIIDLLPVPPKKIVSEARIRCAQLIRTLSKLEVNWLIIVPITNLEIRTRFLDVGNVRFSKFAKNTEKRILANKKGKYRNLLSNKVLPKYRNASIATVNISAVDEVRAKELALIAINDAIDILRFYRLNAHFRNVNIARNNINTVGRLHRGDEVILCLGNPPRFNQAIPFFEKIGFLFPFKIDNKGRDAIRRDGFNFLSGMLKKKEANRLDLEKRVMSAVHFCALSTYDESITNSFVNNMVSLEALLIKGKEAKSVNIAERVALIVGKNSKQKKWLDDQMVKLYRIRSEIVHAGKSDLTSSDIKLLRLINYSTIVNLLKISKKETFQSISDLINWCKCEKFGKD